VAAEPSLRTRHAELTRDLILRTVVERLEEGAHEEITVPEIARRSGVSLRTIYRYFPSREELIAGAAERVREDLQPTFAEHVDELPELWEQVVRRFESIRTSLGHWHSRGRATRSGRRSGSSGWSTSSRCWRR
jgi:AcrR family transcriptional regulator